MGLRLSLAVVLAAAGLAVGASSAWAQFGVANDCTTPTTGTATAPNRVCWVAGVYNGDYSGMSDLDYIGPPAQESGGHPFVGVTDFTVATSAGAPTGTVSTVRVDVPAGVVSDPLATPKCTDAELSASACPSDTQLGIVKLEAYEMGIDAYVGESVYNLAPDATHCAGYVSDYAFYVSALSERVDICGDVTQQPPNNLYFTIKAPPGAELVASTLIFWGVPGDSGHDPQRGWSCLQVAMACTPPASGPSVPSGTPFLTNPTSCVPAGAITTLTLDDTAGQQTQSQSKTPVSAIGCGSLAFTPKMTLALSGRGQTTSGKHPTLTATVTQAPGQANTSTATVALPLSLALDPNNSQHVCSVAGAAADSCPASTLIGKATVTTPLLSEPLQGNVYLVQGIRTNRKGQQVRTFPALLVTLRGQTAIDLHATTTVSSRSQLVTTFSSLPDLPMSTFTMTVNGGKRGILVVTGVGRSICKRAQRATIALTGHNGISEHRSVSMSTPCSKKASQHK